MKKLALAASAAALVAAPAVAIAGPTAFSLKTSTQFTKSGTTAKPAPQVLTTTITASPAGDYAAARAVVSLDKNFKFNTSKFPACSLAKVKAGTSSTCPAGAKVGTGTATAVVAAANNVASNLTVTAFNGGNNKLYMRVQTQNPIPVDDVMVGTLKSATGKYGKKLDVEIPPGLESVSGFRPTLTKFRVKIGATRNKVPYIATTGCSAGDWSFKAQVFYTDGTNASGVSGSNCTKG